MVYTEYNLQEALASLMGKYGRHLHLGRREGFEQMVRTIGEILELDALIARHLVDSLVSCGLVGFEPGEVSVPSMYRPRVAAGGDRGGRSRANKPRAPRDPGVWRLGPSV